MRLSAQIGSTLAEEWVDEGGAFKEYLEDPEFVSALGLVLWGADASGWDKRRSRGSAMHRIKGIFRYFSPEINPRGASVGRSFAHRAF